MFEAGIFSVAPRVIIFDFGKTIHDFELDLFFNWLQDVYRIPRHHFWDIFSRYPDGLLYEYECGESTANFIKRVRNELELLSNRLSIDEGLQVARSSFSDEEFLSSWTTILDATPVFEDRLDLMRKLHARGYELYVLSNIDLLIKP
jgi:FMN phosphatase YigB (HAD superfamily)